MSRPWSRLVACVSLVVFCITSTPGASVALFHSLGSVSASRACCSCPDFGSCDCPADKVEARGDSPSGNPTIARSAAGEGPALVPGDDCPGRPCPFGPCCANPTCWCHVAYTPYCPTAAAAAALGPVPYAGPTPVDASLHLPPPHGIELLRPPRV